MTELALRYVFSPSLNPIRASAPGANPNTIDLQIMVSNPGIAAVTISKVVIDIPVGEDAGGFLSAAQSLTAAQGICAGWAVTPALVITPEAGSTGQLKPSETIIFTVPEIAVTETPGTVQINVTERPSGVTDSSTYVLVKLPSNFVVTSFTANPAVNNDLDQPITLNWACTEAGSEYSFQLSSDTLPDWPRSDCINDGVCFTVANGLDGVISPGLAQTTTFSLDVVQTQPDGAREILNTIQTVVNVDVPWISASSYFVTSPTGHLVSLHWLTGNAASCSVYLDGVQIADNAPPDTYESGYWVAVPGGLSSHQLSLTAESASGNAQANLNFRIFATTDQYESASGIPAGGALSPDGSFLWVSSRIYDSVSVYSFPFGVKPAPANSVRVPQPETIVFSSTAGPALVFSVNPASIVFVDTATLQPEEESLAFTSDNRALAITPDGTRAFVSGSQTGDLIVIDVPNRRLLAPIQIGQPVLGLAVTPDGSKLVVTTTAPNPQLVVVNLPEGAVQSSRIPLTTWATSENLAVTPDSRYVVVAQGASVLRIDLTNLAQSMVRVPPSDLPLLLAPTPDSRKVLAIQFYGTELSLIDLTELSCTKLFDLPNAVAFAPRLPPVGIGMAVLCTGPGPDDNWGQVASF